MPRICVAERHYAIDSSFNSGVLYVDGQEKNKEKHKKPIACVSFSLILHVFFSYFGIIQRSEPTKQKGKESNNNLNENEFVVWW